MGARTSKPTKNRQQFEREDEVELLMLTENDITEALSIIKYKGSVEWLDLCRIEAVNWVFVLLATAFCVLKGPRLYTSTRAGEIGVFLPLGFRGSISFGWLLHLLLINICSSIISLLAARSTFGCLILDWKLMLVKMVASCIGGIMLFEMVLLNPICSQYLWPSWSSIKTWWLDGAVDTPSDVMVDLKQKLSLLSENLQHAAIPFENTKNHIVELIVARKELSDIKDPDLRRLASWESCTGVMGKVVALFGGCDPIHHALWLLPLTLFIYAWLGLSLLTVPTALWGNATSMIPFVWTSDKTLTMHDISKKVIKNEEGNPVTVYEVQYRDKDFVLTSETQKNLLHGNGTWQDRSKSSSCVTVKGLWHQGRLRVPYTIRDSDHGIFRAIPLIHIQIGSSTNSILIESGKAIMSYRRLIDVSLVTKFETNQTRRNEESSDDEQRSFLSTGDWRLDLLNLIRDQNEMDQSLGLRKRSIIMVMHADHSGMNRGNKKTAIQTAGSVAYHLSATSSHGLENVPIVVVLNMKPTLPNKILTYGLAFKEIETLIHKHRIVEIHKALIKQRNPVRCIMGFGLAIEPLLYLAKEIGNHESVTPETTDDEDFEISKRSLPKLMLFGLNELMSLSPRYEFNVTGVAQLLKMVHKNDRVETNLFLGKDKRIYHFIKQLQNEQLELNTREQRSVKLLVNKRSINSHDAVLSHSLRQLAVKWNRVVSVCIRIYCYFADSNNYQHWGVDAQEIRVITNSIKGHSTDMALDRLMGDIYSY